MRTLSILSLLFFAAPALAQDAATQRTWKAKCASCHGEDGKGQTDQGKKMDVRDMTTADWQKEMSDAKIKEAIEKGLKREKNGKKQEMDAYEKKLKPEQIDNLVKYTRALKK